MKAVLASEWLKLRSVRSTYLILGIGLSTILLGLALAASAAGMYDAAPPTQQARARIADLEEAFAIIPQLCMGVLGTLAMTSEYTTGMIRTSLALVPRRWPVLAAKSMVVGSLGLFVGVLAVFGTYFAARGALGDRFSGAYATAVGDRVPLLVSLSLTVLVFALLGVGLGALLRSAAGATAVIVALVYVLPMIIDKIPEPWSERLGSLMIGALPRQITGDIIATSVYGSSLSPPVAAVVMVAYATVPLTIASWLLCRRDA